MATDATVVGTHDTPSHDTLVPDPQVQKEFSVTAMSIWRWDRDPELIKLGWPPRLGLGPENSAAGSRLRISSASWCKGQSSNGRMTYQSIGIFLCPIARNEMWG